MRIPCPHCGLRPYEEFAYLGDAAPERPAFDNPDHAAREAAFADYVYLRDNPAGRMRELWFHTGGCQAWLEVERDTRSHTIYACRDARSTAENSA
jgi:sarcosine oxidase subunit delta